MGHRRVQGSCKVGAGEGSGEGSSKEVNAVERVGLESQKCPPPKVLGNLRPSDLGRGEKNEARHELCYEAAKAQEANNKTCFRHRDEYIHKVGI